MIVPKKLKKGDLIRVCSPAWSMSIITPDSQVLANKTLNDEFGLKVSFSKRVAEVENFKSGSIDSRVSDLHEAFADKSVNGILTTIGGFNSNQLLPYLDFNLIKKNPKIFCGFSDITALSNAIYAQTGLINYSGMHYSTFGRKYDRTYNLDYFRKAVFEDKPFEIHPSAQWSDDPWYLDQEKRTLIKNSGWDIIHEGKAKGTLVGGNLCTLILLMGTKYMPSLKNSILFIEDDYGFGELFDVMFDRHLTALLQQKGADKIRGILIGRPQKSVVFTKETVHKIIDSKRELNNIPVISNVDFGHTNPLLTLPVGGTLSMEAVKPSAGKSKMRVIRH